MNLPPLNNIAGGYQLPPVNQVPGYSTQGQPQPNPGQYMNQFFVDPLTGEGISVENAGRVVQQYPQGNPLYYGQTASYTGPSGPTDAPTEQRELPPVEEVQQQGGGLTYRDMLTAAMAGSSGGPQGDFASSVLYGGSGGGHMSAPNMAAAQNHLLRGLNLDDQFDPQNAEYMRLLDQYAREGQSRSGGGDGGR